MEEADLAEVAAIERENFSRPWTEEGFRKAVVPSQAPKAGYDICGWLHFLFSWFPPSLFAKLRTFRVKKEYGN